MNGRRHQQKRGFKRVLVTLLTFVMLVSVCFPGMHVRAEDAVGDAATSTVGNENTALVENQDGVILCDLDTCVPPCQDEACTCACHDKNDTNANTSTDGNVMVISDEPDTEKDTTDTEGDTTETNTDPQQPVTEAPADSQQTGTDTSTVGNEESKSNETTTQPEVPSEPTVGTEAPAHIDGCLIEGCAEDCACTCHTLFNRLMACTSIGEMDEIYAVATEEEWAALTEEELALIDAHYISMEPQPEPEIILELPEPPVESEVVYLTVNYDNVADFVNQ